MSSSRSWEWRRSKRLGWSSTRDAGASSHPSATRPASGAIADLTSSDRGLLLELEVLVGRDEWVPGDRRHLGQPRPDPDQRGLLHDRREHRALVHELLDPVQEPFTALGIHLARLIAEERIDVGIAAVRADPTRDHEGLDARRGVAGGAAADPHQVLELLFLVGLVKARALHRA